MAHVDRVRELGLHLASKFSVDQDQTELACLGHDLAREWSDRQLLEAAQGMGLEMSPQEAERPVLLHGRIAAGMMAKDFGIRFPAVIEAVSHHTLGAASLGKLAKILIIADSLEPGRTWIDSNSREAILGLGKLDEMLLSLLEWKKRRWGDLAPQTQRMYEELLEHET